MTTQMFLAARLHWPALHYSIDDKLEAIRAQLQQAYSELDLTGACFLADEMVYMLLEGPFGHVQHLFGHALGDKRISQLRVVAREDKAFRLFAHQPLQLCDLRESARCNLAPSYWPLAESSTNVHGDDLKEAFTLLSLQMEQFLFTERHALI
ncbi:BLUF domain-containing protein [Polycladidibacter stylochi]|uniref:BLUF domain-containing protein n=1 Tax=Polycladidibacter stylochi TaxID=1807766 RepID=UPI0008379B60|nr:BLUF domain-containing protein [Pseudovibrio stylochi]